MSVTADAGRRDGGAHTSKAAPAPLALGDWLGAARQRNLMLMTGRRAAALLCATALLLACGGSSKQEAGGNAGSGGSAASGGVAGVGAAAGSGASSGSAGASGGSAGVPGGTGGGGTSGAARCGSPAPAGAPEPPPSPSYSGGSCPKLVPGSNTLASSNASRKFLLVVPKDLDPSEKPPLIFLWHWLGGEAKGFLEKGEIQAAADTQRFIAVIPEKKGDLLFVWPVEVIQSQARVNEELTFFDDMYACVNEQFPIDRSCVSSAGVSAGALFTDQLASARADYLASFISLSGGVGGVIRPWGNPAHKLPGLVLWGGPTDACAGLFSFDALSKTLENDLVKGGHFFLECIHNCGHSEPPFLGTSSKYQGLWEFVLDHPYWLSAGASPYNASGVPASLPEWCGIGKGSATPRTGACIDGSQC